MRKALGFRATTDQLAKQHLYFIAFEASLEDGSPDLSGNSMKFLYVDEQTKGLIEQYEPSFSFSKGESFYLINECTYNTLYGTGSGIKPIEYRDVLVMKFREMKAHLQGYFEQKQGSVAQAIYDWGGEQVESVSTTPKIAVEKIQLFLNYYQKVNDFDFEARKVVDRIQSDYPFDDAIYNIITLDKVRAFAIDSLGEPCEATFEDESEAYEWERIDGVTIQHIELLNLSWLKPRDSWVVRSTEQN